MKTVNDLSKEVHVCCTTTKTKQVGPSLPYNSIIHVVQNTLHASLVSVSLSLRHNYMGSKQGAAMFGQPTQIDIPKAIS